MADFLSDLEMSSQATSGAAAGTRSPAAFTPPDMPLLLQEISRTFDPLREGSSINFRVSEVQDGFVCLSVVLPAAMTRAFVGMLDSLHGLVRLIDNKTRHRVIEAKSENLAHREKLKQNRLDFEEEICALFDGFIDQGMSQKEAVAATNKTMKAKKHPWAVYHLVQDQLRELGRLKRKAKHPLPSKPVLGGDREPLQEV